MSKIRENLAKNIDKYLKLRNVSKKDLAVRLGVSAPAVTNWIKGKNSPDIEYIAQMCKIFNVSVSDLINIENRTNNTLEMQLLNNFYKLDMNGKNDLLDYSVYLLGKHAQTTKKQA